MSRQAAFTLIELIATLVVIAIVAIFALPRFASVDVFEERGFFEEALAATRYAQKLATASGCSIGVSFTAATASFVVSRWVGGGDCTQRVGPAQAVRLPGPGYDESSTPSDDSSLSATAPDGVTLDNDLEFYFDRVGRPHDMSGNLISDPSALQIRIGERRLRVTPETGLVRGD